MRKNTGFAIATTMLGVAMIFWARSAVLATGADIRPKAGVGIYEVVPSGYLPIQSIEPAW
jgi:hypothetical protein